MRKVFEEELNRLNRDMISMGALCENAINTSISFLAEGQSDRKQVLDLLDQISHKEREIENMCLRLLMQQQPVASDLRTISAALKLVSDMERIGDNADDIAEIISMEHIHPADMRNLALIDMAKETGSMLNNAIGSFVHRDADLARATIDQDDVIDKYFNQIKVELADNFSKTDRDVDAILDLFMISKYFERIGDHSVNIAQWVLFMITGVLEGNTH